MKNYIFISYAHRDSDRVFPVIKKLQESGYNVWYDDGIDPGTEWAKNISKHIVECSYFIAFMSQAYLDSKNCNEEWHFARDEEKKRFLVYIEDVKLPDDMRMRSSMIQNLFMHKYGDKEEFYRKLFAAEGIEVCKNAEPEGEIERGAVEAVEEYEETPKTQEEEKKAEVVKSFRNILYTDDGEAVTIVGCKEGTKNLTIPEEVKGMPVEKIGKHAFDGNHELITIKLSRSLEEIGVLAFKDCVSLTDVNGIYGACEIASDAFEGCMKLKRNPLHREEWEEYFEIEESEDGITICKCIKDAEEIVIPDMINGKPVIAIGKSAFKGCTGLAKIDIPEGVTQIGYDAFGECTRLTGAVIPKSVVELGFGAFTNCSNLLRVVIPESVTVLSKWLFLRCKKLNRIVIPKKVKFIDGCVFSYCDGLKHIKYAGKTEFISMDRDAWDKLKEDEKQEQINQIPEGKMMILSDAFVNCPAIVPEFLDDATLEMLAVGGHKRAKARLCYLKNSKSNGANRDKKIVDEYYQKADESGSAEAQYKQAEMYMEGTSVEKDVKKAIEHYQKAAEYGNADAQYKVAKIYMEGKCVEQDVKKAIEYYQQAAENGHAEAQYMMAEMYEEGGILEKNEKKALRFYRKSAKNGNIEAQEKIISMFVTGEETEIDELEIKQMYYNFLENSDEKKVQRFFYVLRINMVLYSGADEKETIFEGWTRELAEKENVFAQLIMAYLAEDERHFEEAIKWYQKVAKKGDVRIQYKLGSLFEQEGDVQEAVMWYQKAAEKGHKKAQNQVGQLYDKLKERDDAIKWYQVVEQQGDVDVQYRLGQLFEEKQDWLNAVRYYQKAAENDVVEAQCKMAFNALDGKGMKKDMSEAVKWYKKAVDNKNTIAEFGLAMLHLTGRGVEQDFDKAHELFQCAAKQEHSIACLMLALLYGTGRGVEQDDDMARHWCERACAKGKWNKNDIPYESGKQYRLIEINEWVNRIFRDVEVLQEDLALALEWHFDTAEESDAVACCNLGYMHEMGWGVEPDRKKAMEWYQKAVEVGDSNAARLLKRCKKSTGWGKILGIFS